MIDSLYRDELLEHIRNPKNFGSIKKPTYKVKIINTSCGDQMNLYILVKDNKIVDIKFNGQCCAIAKASASMLSQELLDSSFSNMLELDEKVVLKNFLDTLTEGRKPCALLIYKAVCEIKNKVKYEK